MCMPRCVCLAAMCGPYGLYMSTDQPAGRQGGRIMPVLRDAYGIKNPQGAPDRLRTIGEEGGGDDGGGLALFHCGVCLTTSRGRARDEAWGQGASQHHDA